MNISWTSPEYMHTHKTSDWYWIVSIVALTCAVIAFLLHNPIFALFIMVAAFVLMLSASRPPQIITTMINNRGVTVGKSLYLWTSLESFWIEEEQLHPRLLLKTNRRFAPYVVVLLNYDEAHPEDIHAALMDYLPEVKHSEPFLEKLLIWLGF